MVHLMVALLLLFALGAWIHSLGPLTAPASVRGVFASGRRGLDAVKGRFPNALSALNRIRGPTPPNPAPAVVQARRRRRLHCLRARARPGAHRRWVEAEWVVVP